MHMERAIIVSFKENPSLPLYLIILYEFKTHLWTTIPTASVPLYMKEGLFWVFRMLNKWMRNALSVSCPHFEVHSKLMPDCTRKGPMTTCPAAGGGTTHFKVYSVSQWNQKTQPLSYHNLLCPSSTLLLLCHTSIRATEQRCWGSCVAWEPGILGNPPCMQRCLLSPTILSCEGRKIGTHA